MSRDENRPADCAGDFRRLKPTTLSAANPFLSQAIIPETASRQKQWVLAAGFQSINPDSKVMSQFSLRQAARRANWVNYNELNGKGT
jgi:hypothetical protein